MSKAKEVPGAKSTGKLMKMAKNHWKPTGKPPKITKETTLGLGLIYIFFAACTWGLWQESLHLRSWKRCGERCGANSHDMPWLSGWFHSTESVHQVQNQKPFKNNPLKTNPKHPEKPKKTNHWWKEGYYRMFFSFRENTGEVDVSWLDQPRSPTEARFFRGVLALLSVQPGSSGAMSFVKA